MPNYNEIFEKQGSLFLNSASYELITLDQNPENVKTFVLDEVKTELIDDNSKLKVIFTRKIQHEPKVLFNLIVSFGAIYTFKESYLENDLSKIDFTKMLKANDNRLFINIISRTSQLIAEITSSHGSFPLVTPPAFVDNVYADIK